MASYAELKKFTIQATFLSALSNILAQFLEAYQSQKPFTLSLIPVLQFCVFAALNTPPNIIYQAYLEHVLPSYVTASSAPPAETKEQEKVKENPKGVKKLSILNTVVKILIDQTLGSALNNLNFIMGMGLLKGLPWNEITQAVRKDVIPIVIAGWKVWPLVALVNFTMVPFEHRVLVGSTVGIGWGVYLSMIANAE